MMIHRRERGRRREKDLVVHLKQYFIDIADEASLWPANIINLGSIYPRLWWRMADPKKKETSRPRVRTQHSVSTQTGGGEYPVSIVIFSDFPPINPITIYQANASL